MELVLVYIDEAHAQDEWPISSSRFNGDRGAVCLQQTRTLRERCAAATGFAASFGFDRASGVRMAVDNPERVGGGAFQEALSPWPVRMYIFQHDLVRFVSEPGSNSDIEMQPFADALRLAAVSEGF